LCRCDHASDRLDQARVIVLDPRWAAAPRRSVWRRSCQTLFGRRLRSRNSGRDCRWATSPEFRQQPAIEFAGDLEAAHRQDHVGVARTRVGFALDSLLEGGGFEPPVPRQRRHPAATANHLSEPRRPVFKIELKPRRSAMTLSLPANDAPAMLFWASTGSPAMQPRWIASPN
jgi:hypothetical protein